MVRPAHRKPGLANGVTIYCYMREVPAFVEAELDRLYGSIYSSLGQFRIYGAGEAANTYIVRMNGRAITILLFQVCGAQVRVLNEVVGISSVEINRFARYVFSSFVNARVIRFRALRTDRQPIDFPSQRFNHLEDIVLALPPTEEKYLALLGKNTRRNIKRYGKKLLDAFPSFRFRVLHTDQVDAQVVRDIVHLNQARMANKKKVSAIDEWETEALIRRVHFCGLVGVATIDGRICAGAISFRAGSNYFLSVLAHDPPYDQFWLGMLCCYMTICECIQRGGKEFHFLWGEYQYKYLLLGVRRELDNLVLYKSRWQLFLHASLALQVLRAGLVRRMRVWLYGKKREDRRLYRILTKVILGWRWTRHVALRWRQMFN